MVSADSLLKAYEPIELDRYLIDEIHKIGGTYLGTSRGGGQRVEEIVDCLERDGINMLLFLVVMVHSAVLMTLPAKLKSAALSAQ